MTEPRANNQPILIWLSAIPQEQATLDTGQGRGRTRIFDTVR
jgi:hypothetical protein